MAKTIARARKIEENFTVICNTLLRDKRLSWAAKGIMAYLKSNKEDFVVNQQTLVTMSGDTLYGVKKALKELQEYRYLYIFQERSENGKDMGDWIWMYDDEPWVFDGEGHNVFKGQKWFINSLQEIELPENFIPKNGVVIQEPISSPSVPEEFYYDWME